MTEAQTWVPNDYRTHAGFVAELGAALIELLGVDAPARVLDFGCGDGRLSAQLSARGHDVVGIDASEPMIRAARQRGVAAHVADGHALSFTNEFDAVFSNATLHWLTRPDDAIASVHRALRPGGVFVGEFGGAGNLAKLIAVLVDGLIARGVDGAATVPWHFPSTDEYATRLSRGGFRVDFITRFDRPTPLPTDVSGWIATFGESFTRALPEAARAGYVDDVRARLAGELMNADGRWVLDYVRLRFRATKRA